MPLGVRIDLHQFAVRGTGAGSKFNSSAPSTGARKLSWGISKLLTADEVAPYACSGLPSSQPISKRTLSTQPLKIYTEGSPRVSQHTMGGPAAGCSSIRPGAETLHSFAAFAMLGQETTTGHHTRHFARQGMCRQQREKRNWLGNLNGHQHLVKKSFWNEEGWLRSPVGLFGPAARQRCWAASECRAWQAGAKAVALLAFGAVVRQCPWLGVDWARSSGAQAQNPVGPFARTRATKPVTVRAAIVAG